MKPSEIFTCAAKYIDFERRGNVYVGCCWAVSVFTRRLSEKLSEEQRDEIFGYLNLFRPSHKSSLCYWFGKTNEGNVLPRVLCLLFAAEIARSEGK